MHKLHCESLALEALHHLQHTSSQRHKRIQTIEDIGGIVRARPLKLRTTQLYSAAYAIKESKGRNSGRRQNTMDRRVRKESRPPEILKSAVQYTCRFSPEHFMQTRMRWIGMHS